VRYKHVYYTYNGIRVKNYAMPTIHVTGVFYNRCNLWN